MSKQFGAAAKRVSTAEMQSLYTELNDKVGKTFAGFELTLTLEEKQDHGDTDILVLLHPDQDIKPALNILQPLRYVKNGYCHSFLYRSSLGDVHVDFLVSSDPNLHQTKKQYYSFNDLSSVIGIMAKSLNFKYGSEGFFKRYQDKRGNWHDILISVNLNPGLQCLGLSPKPLWIKKYQDIVDYVSGSLLFDSGMYSFVLNEEPGKRTKQHGLMTALAELKKPAAVADEDYFFRRQFPAKYAEVETQKKEIDEVTYRQSRFGGNWLIENFGMKTGPDIGKMLKAISDEFGDLLNEIDENVVKEFVKRNL